MPAKRRRTLACGTVADGVSATGPADCGMPDAPEQNAEASPRTLDFWMGPDAFEADHLGVLYRADSRDPGREVSFLGDKADQTAAADAIADAAGFPSPFLVLNLGDRSGVWQSEPAILKKLGEDPASQFRQVQALSQGGVDRKVVTPAGLRNLGATCYLNSLLQYLYFNVDFRRGLLQATSDSEVVRALQKLFALMSASKRSIVDPSEFVRVAGVDAVEQEDASEFSTLLLDWLERALNDGQQKSSGGSFIPALFQGEVTQILTCLEEPGHTFARREPFYELRGRLSVTSGTKAGGNAAVPATINGGADGRWPASPPPPLPPAATVVEGVAAASSAAGTSGPPASSSKRQGGGKRKAKAAPTPVRLEELLTETTFPDEMLDGANQYHCPKCNKKVNARKSIRLAQSPRYLHITIERYHYDLQKGVREKLNNPVSFPKQLDLRLCRQAHKSAEPAPEESRDGPEPRATQPEESLVAYDCVGFLEHVSDSAHSGHYTATLYQQDEAETRTGRADAGEGCSSTGVWWTLDDFKVSPVTWQSSGQHADASTQTAEGNGKLDMQAPPGRIESASAYLILYRRRDSIGEDSTKASCDQRPLLPEQLAAFVSSDNSKLESEREEYAKQSLAVNTFLKGRRLAVQSLIQVLRNLRNGNAVANNSATAFVVVPTVWWNAFLRGEDRSIQDLLQGKLRLAPVTYGRVLLRSSVNSNCQVLDPLAVWCGDVKLVPAQVFDQISGVGGLDSALFPQLTDCISQDVCRAAWSLQRLYQCEWAQVCKILTEGKVSAADARSWQSQGRGNDAVWVSLRVQKMWQKIVGPAGGDGASQQRAAFQSFLREAHAARWAGHQPPQGPPDADRQGGDKGRTASGSPACPSAPASPAEAGEVNLTAGLLCAHGLVGNSRAGFLVRRLEVEQLLKISEAKERAYLELWPHLRAVPRLRTGLPDQRVLGFLETCAACRCEGGGPQARAAAPAAQAEPRQRQLCVKRRYPATGVTRKQGLVAIPDKTAAATPAVLRELVREQLKLPVARLLVERGGEAVELGDDDVLEATAETIVVEKDEKEVPDREAVAFQGSIFRNGSNTSLC